jgi:hypothetical protein
MENNKYNMSYDAEDNRIQGWMDNSELSWLYEQACLRKTIVEIGTWRGRSAHALCSGANISNGTVYCIDTFKGSPSELDTVHIDAKTHDIYKECVENLSGFKNVVILKMSSIESAGQFEDKSIDMIFIDSEHTYDNVMLDVNTWFPKLKDGGLFCGHDKHWGTVLTALSDRFGKDKIESGPGNIWVYKSSGTSEDKRVEKPQDVFAYVILPPAVNLKVMGE